MYLKRIISENVGPISKIDIIPSFNQDGTPKPLILVGENGSGKSTVLSNIVDSFYEIASKAFNNAQISSDGFAKDYYKLISPDEIRCSESYMYSYLEFSEPNTHYVFKAGNLSSQDFFSKNSIQNNFDISWENSGNYKHTTVSKNDAENAVSREIVCYFPPNRYEKPFWLGQSYYDSDNKKIEIKGNWNGLLKNPIIADTGSILSWLLDLIADSRCDVEPISGKSFQIIHQNTNDLQLLILARKNIESIMSQVLGKKIYFSLNFRNSGLSRFRIMDAKKENDYVAPTLDSLSTGQLAIFDMFATIARYGDTNNINKSIRLNDIGGIVVIDEIELHLHPTLQKEVLPKLMRLFPKVQFIITSHSPLFLLGMRDVYGNDGFDVVEMPSGHKIDIESFSEFRSAYENMKNTQAYNEDVERLIAKIKENSNTVPLIITEGSTDWKHLLAAYNALSELSEYEDLFKDLRIEFLKYEPDNSDDDVTLKMKMGATVLSALCENAAKLPNNRKYIFIADRDRKDINEKFSSLENRYKFWGNNVYSFVLPVPEFRNMTPNICIEHLYSDDEIKTESIENGIPRRLYMGNEFNEFGIAKNIDRFCEKRNSCGPNHIEIIEGRDGEKVYNSAGDKTNNYSLTKTIFAKNVLEKKPPFDQFNFSNFVEVFRIIKDICSQNND